MVIRKPPACQCIHEPDPLDQDTFEKGLKSSMHAQHGSKRSLRRREKRRMDVTAESRDSEQSKKAE
eukprot:360313-Chlamydomonas_euryale.AAC.1